MANIYETLITGSAPDAGSADASHLASGLRGRDAWSNLAQISGDSILAPMGARQAKQVRSDADKVRKSALEKAKRKQVAQRLAQQKSYQDQVLAGQEAGRAQQLKIANQANANRLAIAQTNATKARKASPAIVKKLAGLDTQLVTGKNILSRLTKELAGGGDHSVNAAGDLARSILPPGLRNYAEGQSYDPAQQKTRNEIHRFIAAIRKLELGSAVTGYELGKEQEWSPIADGITQEESIRRFNTFIRDHQNASTALRNQAFGEEGDLITEGNDPALQQQPPPAPEGGGGMRRVKQNADGTFS